MREICERKPTDKKTKNPDHFTIPSHTIEAEQDEVRESLKEYEEELAWLEENRPKTRGECINGLRPCPFLLCRYHLYLEISRKNRRSKKYSIKINHAQIDSLLDMKETCALDVADEGEHTLEDVGDLSNITRERIRQVENVALRKVMIRGIKQGLKEFI